MNNKRKHFEVGQLSHCESFSQHMLLVVIVVVGFDLIALRCQLFIAFIDQKKKVPFSMAVGNGELMHECFPKHLRMGTARMKFRQRNRRRR